nr:immunoglobulin heavy chain junction region [Macaca mulatta]
CATDMGDSPLRVW